MLLVGPPDTLDTPRRRNRGGLAWRRDSTRIPGIRPAWGKKDAGSTTGDGTVTDTCLGLTWQQDTLDTDGDGFLYLPQDGLLWQDAMDYAADLEFSGHDDWRLPSVYELFSIVEYHRSCCPPSIRFSI